MLQRPLEPKQDASAQITEFALNNGLTRTMGLTGICWDPMAESFFSELKNERERRPVYATKKQARCYVIAYIEGFYNSRRRHSPLGYRRPNKVHYSYQQPALAA